MPVRLVQVRGAALAVTAGLVLGGCSSAGGSTSSAHRASTVLPAMESAVKSATSVHMIGAVTPRPGSGGAAAITLNVSFDGTTGMSGTITIGGTTLGLLTRSETTYIKISAGYLAMAKAPAAECRLVCGKWVEVPGGEAQSITGSLSMSGLIQAMFSKLPAAAKSSSAPLTPGTYHGDAVLTYKHDGTSVVVAANGTPYPLAINGPNGQYLDFSDWNSVTLPPAPPASQVISLSQLG